MKPSIKNKQAKKISNEIKNPVNEAVATHRHKFWKYAIVAVLFVTLLVFIPATNNDFVNWDDDWQIIENELIRSLSPDNLNKIYTEFYHGQYSPITFTLEAITYSFAELKPAPYHIVGVIIHLINTFLVYVLIYQILKHRSLQFEKKSAPRNFAVVPLITALLFGIHTLQVESVAWVAAHKVVLYTTFFLLASLMYIRYLVMKRAVWLAASLSFFALSFGSKEQAMVLPVLLVAFDFYLHRPLLSKKVILEKIPFFALAIVFGIVSLFSQQDYGAISDSVWFSYIDRIPFAAYAFVVYFGMMIFPYKLSAFYPFPVAVGQSAPAEYWGYVVVALIIIAATVYSLKRNRHIMFGMLIYAINIFLTLQLVSTGREVIIADRYVYIPAIGFFFLIGMGIHYLIETKHRLLIPAVVLFAAYTLYLGAYTYQRCEVWQNGIVFWTDVQEKYPNVHVAFYNRGNALAALGKHEEAIADFTKAVPLKPTHVGTYSNRGVSYANLGKINEALVDFNKVVQLDSLYSNVYSNRGNTKILLGDLQGALADYNKAIRIDSSYMDAYYNRGIVKDSLGDYTGAIRDWTITLQKDPTFANAYLSRGIVYLKAGDTLNAQNDLGRFQKLNPKAVSEYLQYAKNNENAGRVNEAIDFYSKVIALAPTNAEAYFGRGGMYDAQNQLNKALADFDKAIALDSKKTDYYSARGVTKGKGGRLDLAIDDFNKAIEVDPNSSNAYSNRGLAKMRQNKTKEAIKDYDRAIELKPDFAMAYNNRALAKRSINDAQGALADFSKVIELSPQFGEAYYYRGLIYSTLGNKDAACADMQKAASLGIGVANDEAKRLCGTN